MSQNKLGHQITSDPLRGEPPPKEMVGTPKTWKKNAGKDQDSKESMKLIAHGSEKAKRHLIPSSDKPKNEAFATLPHRSETSSSKPLEEKTKTRDCSQPFHKGPKRPLPTVKIKEKEKAAQSLDKKRGATRPGQRQTSSSSTMHAKKPNTT